MTSADSLTIRGNELHVIGKLDAAKVHYEAALRLTTNYLPALMNLADILSRQNKLNAAAAIAARAVEACSTIGSTWCNLGNFLTRLERYDEARVALINAIEIAPSSREAWHNLLLLDLREGNITGAKDCYNKVVAIGGDSVALKNDYAHVLLSEGDLNTALEIYEARWHYLCHLEPWDFHIPEWQGESLVGKRLLVHHEQGFGDTIMTSRFLQRSGLTNPLSVADITFAVPSILISLFQSQDWNIDIINMHEITEEEARKFDFHSPLYSLMRYLKVRQEDIDPAPYLAAPPLVVSPVQRGTFNVGICWASGAHRGELGWRRRVSDLQSWLSLAEIPGVQLYSLYPGEAAQAEIMSLGAESLILDHVTSFTDFAETAAFVKRLDLVVSVDTAVAHLSAAMGVPTWMLSQFTPCWRWWGLKDGTGKPWYSSMEVLSQPKPGGWKLQLEECTSKLQQIVNGQVFAEIAA